MAKKPRAFISHKNDVKSNAVASAIEQRLLREGYDVFFDKTHLQGGHNWKVEILEALQKTDVLIVILEESTASSDWVQREVDMARGANIQILPVLIETSPAVQRLDLSDIQYLSWDAGRIDDIISAVNRLLTHSYDSQKIWIKAWQKRHDVHLEPRAINSYRKYRHPDVENCTFHIAQGNAIELDAYEVLVNTENTFMQMARAYETNTLSCSIRRAGSYIQGGFIKEDTIQEELFNQIKYSKEHPGVPLLPGEVIATGTGHPQSELANKKTFRYIFHAASVEIQKDDRSIAPLSPPAIGNVIEKCLKRTIAIEKAQGAFLWQPSGQLEDAKAEHRPITSIVFPVFGAGQGGGKFKDSIEPILQGFINRIPRYLDNKEMNLRSFGLCIYDPSKLQTVTEAFEAAGFILK